MADNTFRNDPLSRTVLRSFLLLQLAAMAVVLGLSLADIFFLALLISCLTFCVLIAAILWLYARYQNLPVVRQKRILKGLVLKFQRTVQVEEDRIEAAIQERARLLQKENEEIHTALSALQRNYIEAGLENASIHQAAIPRVGPRFKERLAGYGILSASQISNGVAQLPGFGVEKCRALLAWRSSVLAKLERTKPTALPPEQVDAIKQKYQALQDQNNAAEQNAITSQQILQYELISLRPQLRGLASISFLGYLSHSLASRGIVAAGIAFVLVIMQVVSSVSATLAFGASNAAAVMESIPTATLPPAASLTPASTATAVPSQTSIPTITTSTQPHP